MAVLELEWRIFCAVGRVDSTNLIGGIVEALITSRVIHVTSEHRFKELIETNKRSVVVDFSASWCSPCRYISPVYHELSAKYPCTIFLKVDVDELKSVAKNYGVRSMPTFQFFRDGVKCDEMRGADRNGLEARIQKHYLDLELPEDQVDGKLLSNEGLRKHKSQVVTVTTEKQWEQLLKQNRGTNKALVVDFWATWCKPCVEIAPFFEELSCRFPAAVFARVEVDELESVTAEFDVSSLPCFKVFKGGKAVDDVDGAIRGALERMVARHYGAATAAASC